MAKGNMLLGYARGKVGSLVFARRKGEQITRSRNTAPANPRTHSQLGQRMKMYAPVKFYRQSLERFFKYAFSVSSHETVFNAFMRENIAVAPWTAKNLVTEQAPVPYPARMSSGGIGALPVITGADLDNQASVGTVQVVDNETLSLNAATMLTLGENVALNVGAVSTALINANIGLRTGDQLTFVAVGTKGLSSSGNNVSFNGTDGFEFIYKAFVLEPGSSVSLSSLGFVSEESAAGNYLGIELPFKGKNVAMGGCIIVTRSSNGKVEASNSSLALNGYAASIYATMRTEEYRGIAELSYKMRDAAVLDPATTLENQKA